MPETARAYFNPATVSLHFLSEGAAFGSPSPAPSPAVARHWTPEAHELRSALARVPTAVLAHELSHLLLATMTGAGVREFQLTLEALHYDDSVVRILAREDGGVVTAPVVTRRELWEERSATSDEGLTARIFIGEGNPPGYPRVDSARSAMGRSVRANEELRMLTGGVPLVGGEPVVGPPPPLASGGVLSWLQHVQSLAPMGPRVARAYGRVPRTRTAVDMRSITGEGYSVLAGTQHLHEGFGIAVELLQRRFTDEQGARAGDAGTFSDHPGLKRNADPYFLAQYVYNSYLGAASRTEDEMRDVCLEEFCLLADLAMMCDGEVLRLAGLDPAGLSTRPDGTVDVNPFDAFVRFCDVLALNARRMPRLQTSWEQGDVNGFQDSVLAASGSSLDVLSLTEAAEHFFDQTFAAPTRWSFRLWEVFERVYRNNLALRRRLGGGSPFLALMTQRDDLVWLLQRVDPVLSVDGSGGELLEYLQAFRLAVDTSQAVVYGNRPCVLHEAEPRECQIAEWSMCHGLSDRREPGSACPRDQALSLYLRSNGLTGLRWG